MIHRIIALAIVVAPGQAAARCAGGQTVSWYGEPQRLSGGGVFEPDGVSCASRDHRRGETIRVTDLDTGRSVDCLVNDYGPNAATGCKVDVSRGAAKKLGILGKGVARGRIERVSATREASLGAAEGGYVARNWPTATTEPPQPK